MKRFAIGFGLAVIATTGAYAECDTGSNDVLSMTEWTLDYEDQGEYPGVSAVAEFKYSGGQGFRMIEAKVHLDDALGGYLVHFAVDPDLAMQPEDNASQVFGPMPMDTFPADRLIEVNPDDVVAQICVQSIVYEDGTVERFD